MAALSDAALIDRLRMARRWSGLTEAEREFCASVIAQAARPGFVLSPLQHAWAGKIADRWTIAMLRAEADAAPDPQANLFEEGP